MKKTTFVVVWVCNSCNRVYRAREVSKDNPVCECKNRLHCTTLPKDEVEEKVRECRVDILMRDNPRWSDAMGINPDDSQAVAEAARRFPDSTYDSEGRLLIRNRHHKIHEMRRRGYYD